MVKNKDFIVYRVGLYARNWMYQPTGNMIEMRVNTYEDGEAFTKELKGLLDKYRIKTIDVHASKRLNDDGELSFEDFQNYPKS